MHVLIFSYFLDKIAKIRGIMGNFRLPPPSAGTGALLHFNIVEYIIFDFYPFIVAALADSVVNAKFRIGDEVAK